MNANDGATHAGVNGSVARLSHLENANGQHNRPVNGVQNANANGRMGVINLGAGANESVSVNDSARTT